MSITVLESFGRELYRHVGVKPSGNPFNSLVQLEHENGIPRNPFINAGAILIVDALLHGVMGISVYAPELNEHGNSLIGTKALELFTTKTKLSIF